MFPRLKKWWCAKRGHKPGSFIKGQEPSFCLRCGARLRTGVHFQG
jgi:hypothetical protein